MLRNLFLCYSTHPFLLYIIRLDLINLSLHRDTKVIIYEYGLEIKTSHKVL